MILPDFILVLKKGFTYGLVVVIYIVSIVANGHMENYINVSLSQQLRSTLCSELFETMQTRSLLQNYSHCLVVSLKHMSIFSKQLKEKGFFLQFFTRLKLQASKRKNVLNSGYRTVRGKVTQRNRVQQSCARNKIPLKCYVHGTGILDGSSEYDAQLCSKIW